MRILHILDHSLPLHSGYTFRSAAILREQQRLGWEERTWRNSVGRYQKIYENLIVRSRQNNT